MPHGDFRKLSSSSLRTADVQTARRWCCRLRPSFTRASRQRGSHQYCARTHTNKVTHSVHQILSRACFARGKDWLAPQAFAPRIRRKEESTIAHGDVPHVGKQRIGAFAVQKAKHRLGGWPFSPASAANNPHVARYWRVPVPRGSLREVRHNRGVHSELSSYKPGAARAALAHRHRNFTAENIKKPFCALPSVLRCSWQHYGASIGRLLPRPLLWFSC